jgi:hypothetical protein
MIFERAGKKTAIPFENGEAILFRVYDLSMESSE